MALALDEPNDQDQTEEQAGYTFCVNKTLLDQIQAVDPAVPFASDGASSCGSCGGGCGS